MSRGPGQPRAPRPKRYARGGGHLLAPSEATRRATRDEWRELGFYYEREDRPGRWRFVGSRAGLDAFPRLLERYVRDPRNEAVSEHEHYGPYMYLKVTTWERAELGEDGIRGTLADLARLRDLVAERLRAALPGDRFLVGAEYGAAVSHPLLFEVREQGFDPASADPALDGAG